MKKFLILMFALLLIGLPFNIKADEDDEPMVFYEEEYEDDESLDDSYDDYYDDDDDEDYYYDDDDEPLTGLGATEDGPMICTEGRMWPCPYCGSNDVQTYIDGTAQCHDCRRWYKYTQSWF